MTGPVRVQAEIRSEGPSSRTQLETKFVNKFTKNSATPVVTNVERHITNSVAPTTITQFVGGQDGHHIKLLANDANTTIKNNSNIVTNTGADKVLASGKVYRFTFWKATGKWHEDA